MKESQKLSFDAFLKLPYRHGVYIFTEDNCEFCKDYRESIDYVDNPYMYFVELQTREQKAELGQITGHAKVPQTVGFMDNEISFCEMGILYDLQMEKVFEYLKRFGSKPLSQEELKERIKRKKNSCQLCYYVFPPQLENSIRYLMLNDAINKNEFPIDIDSVAPMLQPSERFRMLDNTMKYAKLVVFSDGKTRIYSELAQKVILEYSTYYKMKFVQRDLK